MKNDDLKQISKLLDQKFDQKLQPVFKELNQHGTILQQHGSILQQHGVILEQHGALLQEQGKTLKQHGKLLRSLKKDQDTILDMLDKEQMSQRKRLDRVEERLGIFSPVS